MTGGTSVTCVRGRLAGDVDAPPICVPSGEQIVQVDAVASSLTMRTADAEGAAAVLAAGEAVKTAISTAVANALEEDGAKPPVTVMALSGGSGSRRARRLQRGGSVKADFVVEAIAAVTQDTIMTKVAKLAEGGSEAEDLMAELQSAMDSLSPPIEVDITGILVSPPTKTVIVTTEPMPTAPPDPGITVLQMGIIAGIFLSCSVGAGLVIWKRALIKEKYDAYMEKRRQAKYGGRPSVLRDEEEEGRPSRPDLQLEDVS